MRNVTRKYLSLTLSERRRIIKTMGLIQPDKIGLLNTRDEDILFFTLVKDANRVEELRALVEGAQTMTYTEDHEERLQRITDTKNKLLLETGHEPLEPENQYCKHCEAPLFVKEHSRLPCPKNPMRTKNCVPLRLVEKSYYGIREDAAYGEKTRVKKYYKQLQWYAGKTIGWVDVETMQLEVINNEDDTTSYRQSDS